MTTQKLIVNAVYLTFNGEQSKHGIGSPCVFLRLAGCPIRCYSTTLGVLCDTPESLEKKAGVPTELDDILERVLVVAGDCRIITLTGGDPLWNRHDLIEGLLWRLINAGFDVSIETSGVVEWERYRWLSSDKLSFVVDYKMASCGADIAASNLLLKKPHLANGLSEHDTVKFVIYDEAEFHTALSALTSTFQHTKAKIAFGVYWDGPLKVSRLVTLMKEFHILDKVYLNVQLHKIVYREMFEVFPPEI